MPLLCIRNCPRGKANQSRIRGQPAVRNVGSLGGAVYAYSESAKANELFLDARISRAGGRGDGERTHQTTRDTRQQRVPFPEAVCCRDTCYCLGLWRNLDERILTGVTAFRGIRRFPLQAVTSTRKVFSVDVAL